MLKNWVTCANNNFFFLVDGEGSAPAPAPASAPAGDSKVSQSCAPEADVPSLDRMMQQDKLKELSVKEKVPAAATVLEPATADTQAAAGEVAAAAAAAAAGKRLLIHWPTHWKAAG